MGFFCIFVLSKRRQMKRYCLLLMMICLSVTTMAQKVWTVKTVPNTRLESNDIHVSDPDGYLSDSIETTINTTLCSIRDKADVFVVTLTSIGDADPKHFATTLFNYWGIGDAETNNGVLLLFVEDQHAMEMETGYGAEETLTDAKCERIFTNVMAPHFRAGDYEGGLCNGVAEIVTVYGGDVPMALKTTLPEDDSSLSDIDDDDLGGYTLLGLFGILLFLVLPFAGIILWAVKNKTKDPLTACSLMEEGGATYVDGLKTSWSGSPWEGKGCLGGSMIGLSSFVFLSLLVVVMVNAFPEMQEIHQYLWVALGTLVLYLTWICYRHNHRVLKTAKKLAETSINPKSVYQAAYDHQANKLATWMAPWLGWIYYLIYKKKIETSNDCRCPKCGEVLRKDSLFGLPESHLAEAKVEALKFTPYRCHNGHEIVVKEKGSQFSKFITCEKCGAYTMKLVDTKIVKQATYSSSGEKNETYVCQHCGETLVKAAIISKLVRYGTGGSSGSSGSRSHSGSSHSSSHGSFGGGRSGGGGHSGRW